MSRVYEASLEQFEDDKRNANKGTVRGKGMLDKSVRKLGAGRSIVVDKNGRIIAGNKTRQAMVEAGITQARVVETDGRELVVVKRMDLDLEEGGAARELAYADNRVAEVDLEWNPIELAGDADAVQWMFDENELLSIAGLLDAEEAEMPSLSGPEKPPFRQMTFTLHESQVEEVERALAMAKQMATDDGPNENSNGNALHVICASFVTRGVQ